MRSQDESLTHQVALAWSMQLTIKVATVLILVLWGALNTTDFFNVKADPGQRGLRFLLMQYWVFAAVPIIVYAIRDVRSRIPRWLIVAFAVIVLILSCLHHLMHALQGIRVNLNSNIMDIVIEMNMIWVLVVCIKWARQPAPEAAVKNVGYAAPAVRGAG